MSNLLINWSLILFKIFSRVKLVLLYLLTSAIMLQLILIIFSRLRIFLFWHFEKYFCWNMTEMHNKGNIKNIAPVPAHNRYKLSYLGPPPSPPLPSHGLSELSLTFIQIPETWQRRVKTEWSGQMLFYPPRHLIFNTRPVRRTELYIIRKGYRKWK